jgi:hypothetical protein
MKLLSSLALSAASLLTLWSMQPAESTGEAVPLQADDRNHFLVDDFSQSKSLAAIPDAVKQAFTRASGEQNFMAEPGGRWQATCVKMDDLPSRQLTFVANNPHYCLVYYEIGGFAESYKLALFSLKDRMARAVWLGEIGGRDGSKVTNLEQLRALLKKEQIGNSSSL